MTAPKIKPCPQCGSIYTVVYAYENGWQHVECDECYYLGPGEGSQLQAIRSHNAAQGIEAATAAETVKQGSVHESPVGNADAPKSEGSDGHAQ